MLLFSKQHCRIDKSSAFHTSDVPGTQGFLTPKVICNKSSEDEKIVCDNSKMFATYLDVDT